MALMSNSGIMYKTSSTLFSDDENPQLSNYEKFEERIRSLLSDQIVDQREFDFYFQKFLLVDDENANDMFKEIFVMLKLMHSDECSDFAAIDRREQQQMEIAIKQQIQQHNQHLQHLQQLTNQVQTLRNSLLDHAYDYIQKHINAYAFVSKNQKRYSELFIPDEHRPFIKELRNCGYLKETFWTNSLYTNRFLTERNNAKPFDLLRWYDHIKKMPEFDMFLDEHYNLRFLEMGQEQSSFVHMKLKEGYSIIYDNPKDEFEGDVNREIERLIREHNLK